jgi:hypothetical protein
MPEYRGIEYLRGKLAEKRERVLVRYKFYDMKYFVRDFGIANREALQYLNSVVGWCGKAVDSVADRLVIDEFDQDDFGFNDIMNLNNKDIFTGAAIQDALISSCSFIYISKDADGFPRLQTITAGDATGVIDPITYMLTEGYAVLERDKFKKATLEAYFTAEGTWYYQGNEVVDYVENPAPYALLVPIINRPDAMRPFGRSHISRACMSIVKSAIRTIRRSEISAEYYSFPQKYVTGLSQDAERMDTWKATISSFLAFEKDDEGDHPVLGQFQQQSMTPYESQLKMFAGLFAGETGLTLDDMGFPTDNPSSADAIKSQHENLRLKARKAQKNFTIGFLNAMYLAACVRDDFAYSRQAVYEERLKWYPIFEPDASMLSLIGDGAIKLNQAVPNYIDDSKLDEMTGM